MCLCVCVYLCECMRAYVFVVLDAVVCDAYLLFVAYVRASEVCGMVRVDCVRVCGVACVY